MLCPGFVLLVIKKHSKMDSRTIGLIAKVLIHYLSLPFRWCWVSQNHRVTEVGRDLCGSSSPTLLPKQGHLQQAAQDLVQAGLEYLQRRRLHNRPGQPVPVLRHPQREEVLPHVQTELPVPQFVPIAEYVQIIFTAKRTFVLKLLLFLWMQAFFLCHTP